MPKVVDKAVDQPKKVEAPKEDSKKAVPAPSKISNEPTPKPAGKMKYNYESIINIHDINCRGEVYVIFTLCCGGHI